MIREAIVSGKFYQSSPEKLLNQITGCYKHKLGASGNLHQNKGKLLGLIIPHAGYQYSGPVASHAFSRLATEAAIPEVIIILGPKHTANGAAFSVSAHSGWQTPLGTVSVDSLLASMLIQDVPLLKADMAAHQFEHSIEVQLPFIQQLYSETPSIVAVALNYTDYKTIKEIAVGIAKVIAKDTRRIMIIVSSDFSHDTPRDEAYKIDGGVIDIIVQGDSRKFYDLVTGNDLSVCGVMPITALLVILEEVKKHVSLLKYATSMDIIPHDRGVGYAAISFEKAT